MSLDDRLDPDRITANLKTRRIGRAVVVHNQTSSTNDVAAAYAGSIANDGLTVFAEEQTAGRGRTGATWHSSHGQSLLFSFVLLGDCVRAEMLSLAVAVGVAEALGQLGSDMTRIKWPNDIMLAGRKLGGILVESRRTGAGAVYIVGAGINCHQSRDSFPPELQEIATSIDMATGTRCDRNTLARRVLASLDHWLTQATDDRRCVLETWNRLSTQRGQRVTLSYNCRTFTGNCIGVDPEKGLILQLDRGGVRMFDAAHTTIVKSSLPTTSQ